MEYKTQYDIEGNVIPPVRRCCCSPRTSVVWLLLFTALFGGFAGAFLYQQFSRRFFLAEISQFVNAGRSGSEWTEMNVAFAKGAADDSYLVVFRKDGVVSTPEMHSLDEFGSCMPVETKKMLQTFPPGSVFVMRSYAKEDGQCVFDFLKQIELFSDRNSEDEKVLIGALTDQGTNESTVPFI